MIPHKYNFVPDMGVFREQTKPHSGRHYALAAWPHGGLPEACKKAWQFMYFQECMSGFEYAAAALDVRFGSLRLNRLELTAPAGKAATTSVMLAGKPIAHRVESNGGRIAIVLVQSLILSPGQILEVKA